MRSNLKCWTGLADRQRVEEIREEVTDMTSEKASHEDRSDKGGGYDYLVPLRGAQQLGHVDPEDLIEYVKSLLTLKKVDTLPPK